MKKLVLLGAGGHCESILDSLLLTCEFEDIVLVDTADKLGKSIRCCPVVGTDEDLGRLHQQGYNYAFVSAGSVKSTSLRRSLLEKVIRNGYQLVNILDPSARLASSVHMGKGIFVGKNAVINANAVIEDMAIINTGAIVEHGCLVGKFSHISVGAVLCGNVQVGQDCLIGANATVLQGREILSGSIIGAGEVVKTTKPFHETVNVYGGRANRKDIFCLLTG